MPWTRFVKSRNGQCACGNDTALYDNCITFQIPIFSGEHLTCQVFEPLQRTREYTANDGHDYTMKSDLKSKCPGALWLWHHNPKGLLVLIDWSRNG